MLKGIDPVVSPELLKALAEMGHGDEILFADAHFPGRTNARELIRADGGRNIRLTAPKYPLEYVESIEKTCAEKDRISAFYKDCHQEV